MTEDDHESILGDGPAATCSSCGSPFTINNPADLVGGVHHQLHCAVESDGFLGDPFGSVRRFHG